MSDPLLRIRNHHALACGDPPIIDGSDPNLYVGYYENAHGEQWIFTFERSSRTARLRGGDIGWNTVHEVSDGRASEVVLSAEEAAWLQACWNASAGR